MNLGENNQFFRESFRGFNKDDVAEYIAKLSKDYTANEEKYKEHIAKLTAEIKAKTDEIDDFSSEKENRMVAVDEIEQKYKDEINRLANELNDKNIEINNMQSGIASGEFTESEEIAKYQEIITNLSSEIEQLKIEKDESDKQEFAQYDQSGEISETVTQLSFQLAESESEKLFLLNLLKKFISALDIESARGKDVEYASNITDIAPKAAISEEIANELDGLLALKERIGELEAKNAELSDRVGKNKVAPADEQKMYEAITSDLGGIIYSAKKTAEDSIAKARLEADDIVAKAKFEADKIVSDANTEGAEIRAENKRNMAEFRDKYAIIKKEHEDMVQKYKEIYDNYMLHMSEIEGVMNVIYDNVNREDLKMQ